MEEIEDPHLLLGRLKLGREEYCQRLLTMLILDGPYPRWNTPSKASASGLEFLGLLETLSFGRAERWTDPTFVDELDLPRRNEWEKGGAPDQSLQDSQRLWLIELKTEAGSHRTDQIPMYFELGRHHYPKHRIDVTYLTGPLSKPAPSVPDGSRYAHVTWEQVMPLVRQAWSDQSKAHQAVVRALEDVLADLATSWTTWRSKRLDTGVPLEVAPAFDPVAAALGLSRATAQDSSQRALDFAAASLEELQALRLEVLQAIKATGEPELLHALPWLWRPESGGKPMTAAGAESGYELRLSRYKKPIA